MFNMKNVFAILISSTMFFAFATQAEEENTSAVQIKTGSDGIYARTKTLIEAEEICAKRENSDSSDKSVSRDAYISCMASYAPYLTSGSSGGFDCAGNGNVVSWGGETLGSPLCEGTASSAKNNTLIAVSNSKNTKDYQGFAQFICKNGNFEFVKGSCTKLPKPCTAGEIVTWPITSPSWASSEGDPSQDRFDPQPDCAVVMPSALSGQVISATATQADPSHPNSIKKIPFTNWYRQTQSNVVARCFDGNWLVESYSCKYQPGNCTAQTYKTADGCSFDLPAFGHNTKILKTNPLPVNSVGSVEAFCWNGDIEIRAESCKLSCLDNFGSKTWASNGGDGGSCNHGNISLPTRTSPDSTYTIGNKNSTHTGSVTYKCDDGFWTQTGQSCNPNNCVGKPAGSWSVNGNTCNHVAVSDVAPHGQSIIVSSNNLPNFYGQKEYKCNYGSWINGSLSTCESVSGKCYGNTVKPSGLPTFNIPSWGAGCSAQCTISSLGVLTCYDSCSSVCDCNSPCGINNEVTCKSGKEMRCSGGSWVATTSLAGTCSL